MEGFQSSTYPFLMSKKYLSLSNVNGKGQLSTSRDLENVEFNGLRSQSTNVQFNDKIPITVCTIRSTAIALRHVHCY